MLDGSVVRTISLDDYDTWVWGISVAGGKLHLLDMSDQFWIVAFDPISGERRGEVRLSFGDDLHVCGYTNPPSGLWCASPRPEMP